MRKITRAAAALSTGVLAVTLSAGAGGVAGAAPSHGCNYPPGSCQAVFDKSVYHRGDTVGFTTDKAFFRHELVSGKLRCRHHFHRSEGPWRAHHHQVNGTFHLGRHTPRGNCTFTATGERSGHTATGTFTVTP